MSASNNSIEKVLTDFLSQLNVDLANSQLAEDNERLTLSLDCASNLVFAIPLVTYHSLWNAFGAAIRCEFQQARLPIFMLTANTTEQELVELRTQVDDDSIVTLDLEIDKSKYITELQAGSNIDFSDTYVFLYVIAKKFEQYLETASFRNLEKMWWQDIPTSYVVILCPSIGVSIVSPHLAIVTSLQDQSWITRRRTAKHIREKALDVYDGCQENIRWQETFLKFLSPYYFMDVNLLVYSESRLARLYLIRLINLIMLYTADRVSVSATRADANSFLATYSAAQHSQDLKFATIGDFQSISNFSGIEHFAHMFNWLYYGGDKMRIEERLPFLRLGLVEVLLPLGVDRPSVVTLNRMSLIRESVEWRWKVFVSGKIDGFLAQVQVLEQAVDSTVEEFSKQITDLVERLSTSVLAAVGTLIGSLLAAVFADKFNASIFLTGISVYLLYLLLFPFAYGMIHQWDRFYVVSHRFDDTKARFERILLPGKVKATVGNRIGRSRARFRVWYWITFLAYVIVALAVTLLASKIPGILGS